MAVLLCGALTGALAQYPRHALSGTSLQQLAPAAARILETLVIPADGTVVRTSTTLKYGKTYSIRITGAWTWGRCSPNDCTEGGPDYLRWADAAYLSDSHFKGFSDPPWSQYIYLAVNDNRVDLGPFNPNHIYNYNMHGTGNTLALRIIDHPTWYGDNAGSLRAEIIESNDDSALILGAMPFQQRTMVPGPADGGGWGSTPYGDPRVADPLNDTIERWGSALTCWAMALDYWGAAYNFHTNPYELNEWLRQHDGYAGMHIIAAKVAEYAREMAGQRVIIQDHQPPDSQVLHNTLAAGIPVLLETNRHGRYTLAVGETSTAADRPTWYINDPYLNSRFNLAPTLAAGHGNTYTLMSWLRQIPVTVPLASMTVVVSSSAELLVTDPLGRRTGMDPRTGLSYDEIPGGNYSVRDIEDVGRPVTSTYRIKEFYATAPVNGSYFLQIIGAGSDIFTLDIVNYNNSGSPTHTTASGYIHSGEAIEYRTVFSPTAPLGVAVYLPIVLGAPQ